MREGASSEVLAGAAGWWPLVSSWRDGELLAESVPVLSGRLTQAASLAVPSRLTLRVPEWADGRSWLPDGAQHPLSKHGTVLDARLMVWSAVQGQPVPSRLGRFMVYDWRHDDAAGVVEVTALGLLKCVDEDAFERPEAPRAGGTLASELRRLVSPGIPVSIDPALVDRPCPGSLQWPDNRLSAIYTIVEAWPARLREDQYGGLRVLPPLPGVAVPVLTLTDGERGTVVSAPAGDTREGAYNVLVGTSSAASQATSDPLTAVARIGAGPMAATDDGTGYRRVVRRWSTPLAQTQAQLQAAVDTMRDDMARPTVVRSVYHAPDPRVELDDAIEVRSGSRVETVREIVTPAVTHTQVRTNFALNPQATALDFFPAPFNGVLSLADGYGGAASSVRHTATAAGLSALRCLADPGVAVAGESRTVLLTVRASAPATFASARLRNDLTVPASGETSISLGTLPAGVTVIDVTGVWPAGTVGSPGVAIIWMAGSAGDTLDVALVALADAPGDYFDGDTPRAGGTWHAWAGPPHASTSTQSTLVVDTPAVTREVTRTIPRRVERGHVVACEIPLTVGDGAARTDVGVPV